MENRENRDKKMKKMSEKREWTNGTGRTNQKSGYEKEENGKKAGATQEIRRNDEYPGTGRSE